MFSLIYVQILNIGVNICISNSVLGTIQAFTTLFLKIQPLPVA